VIDFLTGGNLEFPQGNPFHFGSCLGGPVNKGIEKDIRIAAPAGAPPDGQEFHAGLLAFKVPMS
jgi:hypothetical protein